MRRIARGRQLRIQLGENKGDKYANRWETKRIMCPNKHLERRTARERERKIEVRARVGENKGDKHGDRQRTRSILSPGSTQREQPHVRVK